MLLKPVCLKNEFADLSRKEKFAAYRSLWQKAQKYEVLTDFPLHLDLELSGKCNFKCANCFQNGLIKTDLGLMETSLYEKIIITGVENGLCAIKLQVRGESFLHPDIFEMIKFAKRQGVLDVQITTNASMLSPKKMDLLMDSGIDAVIFSVDAHHAENFKGNGIDDTGNDYYIQTKKKINYLLHRRLGSQLKKPWVRIRASVPHAEIHQSIETKNRLKKDFQLADLYIVGRIHNFRDDQDAFPDLHRNYILDKCAYLTQRLAIFWNGDATTCCMDYNTQFNLGNVNTADISNIWLSTAMNEFRRRHLDQERKNMPICKHCHACITPVNEDIFMDQTPRHTADVP
ncbi:radical SAM/SPASM domain-containing protein [uncultured Desulfobacter sp.]|uniref:radical SAM/SPASM domain-containing protein n=1 Tax=uncultured Desulfobacter sp. TaxID=240139 RepID=UPI0029C89A49|nr:radical SAM/SPASM domain-containing protein [uncultured Desulfobacter sp.]